MKAFVFLFLFLLGSVANAEYRETRVVNGLANSWRLEQYTGAGGSPDMVVRFVNSTPCDNNLQLYNMSDTIRNRFYAFMLASKIANKPVTIYYVYVVDDGGGKSCNIVSFAADY